MADNTTIGAGTGGDTIASDDVGGVKHQRVKISIGADGVAADCSTSNPLPISDAGGSITVDGTVTANATLAAETTKVIGTVNIAAAQTIATVTTVGAVTAITNALPAGTNAIGKLAANTGVDIGDVDVTSVIPGTGATSLGKAEDAAHTSGDTGVMALAVRRDADTTLADTTGDYAPLQVNAAGSLKVAITSGAGSGGTSIADAAAFTRATTSVTPIAGVVETSAPTLTNGNTGALSLTTGGAVRVNVASGGVSGVVDDAAVTPGTTEVVMFGATFDDTSPDSVNEGDGGMVRMSANRNLYTTIRDAAGNERGLNIDSSGQIAVTMASQGQIADDAAFTPATTRVTVSGYLADDTSTDSVDEGDGGAARMTLNRKQIMQPYESEANSWSYAAPAGGLVTTTGVTAKAAAGAGLRNYVTSIQVINSHQTIGTEVVIRDGAAGTVLHRGWAQFTGGGYAIEFPVPLRGTANTLIEIAEVTATGTAGVLVNLQGYVGA